MTKTLCRICLRTDFDDAGDIDERLTDFHDELCDYDIYHNNACQFCQICKHLLKKFYNFREKCKRAHMILKNTKRKKVKLDSLHELIPHNLAFGTLDNQKFYTYYNDRFPDNIIHSTIHTNTTFTHTDVKPSDKVKLEAAETESVETQTEAEIEDPILITEIKEDSEQDLIPEEVLLSVNQEVQNGFIQDDVLPNKEEDLDNIDFIDDVIPNDDLDKDDNMEKEIDKVNNVIDSDSDSEEKPKPKRVYRKRKTKETKSDTVNDIISVEELKYITKDLNIDEKKVFKLNKKIIKFKDRVSWLLDNRKIDLGENVNLDKETFLKMFEKCDKSPLWNRGVLKNSPGGIQKLKKFLLFLLKRYNPEYESVFDIEYLTTRDAKLAEFHARRRSAEYARARHRCDTCYRAFELPSLLDYHNKWHDTSRPHACDICGMRFSARKHLMVHNRTSHYSVYRCKLCPIVTNIYNVMVNHYDQHKGMQYKCDVCLGEYSSKSSLNTHRLTHATLACARCARRFTSEVGLENHMKYKHSEVESSECSKVVTCEKCNIDFESRKDLSKHSKLIHQRTHIYKCLYVGCVERFETAPELRAHTLASGHVRRGAPARRGLHGGAKARGEAALAPREPHVAIMGPDKPFRTCPICQEQVPNKCPTSLYKHHIAQHPTQPYRSAVTHDTLCEHCGKSFFHISVYRDHLNTHTGAKPYACQDCGVRFHMRRSLAIHSERHRPPRYQCKDCGKMFLTSANLFCHRRTHIGDRRFKCEICFKGFLHSSSLKEHINGVHNHIRRVKKTKLPKPH